MKSVLISIQPKWCEKIANSQKTIEVRKSRPKLETPFKVYIYCTNTPKYHHLYDLRPNDKSGKIKLGCVQHNRTSLVASNYINGKVIGEFVCDKIEKICCRTVPYRRTNNLGYEYFIDNGVYQVSMFEYGADNAVVFERNDRYIDSMLKNDDLKAMCLTPKQLYKYLGLGNDGYGWHISNLVIYDKPKELNEFWVYNEELHKRYESEEDYCAWGNSTTESGCPTNDCEGTDLLQCYQCWEYWSGWCHKLKRPPQSWCYVEELKEKQK